MAPFNPRVGGAGRPQPWGWRRGPWEISWPPSTPPWGRGLLRGHPHGVGEGDMGALGMAACAKGAMGDPMVPLNPTTSGGLRE